MSLGEILIAVYSDLLLWVEHDLFFSIGAYENHPHRHLAILSKSIWCHKG